MDMVEKVARALCARLGRDPDEMVPSIVLSDLGVYGMAAAPTGTLEPAWKRHEVEARAAIEAMREPTKEMIDAPYAAEIDFGPGGTGDIQADPSNVWQAMIDAALNPLSR